MAVPARLAAPGLMTTLLLSTSDAKLISYRESKQMDTLKPLADKTRGFSGLNYMVGGRSLPLLLRLFATKVV